MDAARFSPGRPVVDRAKLLPPPRRARVWATCTRRRIVGQGLGEAASCLANSAPPGPLRASMHMCPPLARKLRAHPSSPETKIAHHECGEESQAQRVTRAVTVAPLVLSQRWATCLVFSRTGMGMVGRAVRRRTCAHGLMSGPGASPRKARSRLSEPLTHCTPSPARCPNTCSVRRRAESRPNNQRMARRKASQSMCGWPPLDRSSPRPVPIC